MAFLDNNDAETFAPETKEHIQACTDQRLNNSDIDYALQAGRGFDALKLALSQLSGTLLLDLVQADRTVVDRSLVEKAQEALREAREAILSCNPRDTTAQHHQHHLRLALTLVEEVADWASRQSNLVEADRSDEFYIAAHAAWDELRKLHRLLNGFQMVDLSQSCCAFHTQLAKQLTNRKN